MDIMLRSMNIDLDVIGYDKASQRWHDLGPDTTSVARNYA